MFAALPDTIGVSLGYENFPSTFVDKGHEEPATAEYARHAKAKGSIYLLEGKGRQDMHRIVQLEYEKRQERAHYEKDLQEAAEAILDACVQLNWNEEWQAYTDMSCQPPERTQLKAWRPIYEIGWTGIAELACPFVMAEQLLGIKKERFQKAKDGRALLDQIAGAYNPASGLFHDLVAPVDESGSLENGWWIWYYIKEECHCAYTNGKGAYGLLKTMSFLSDRGQEYPKEWLETVRKVLDTVILLQREDGNYGYTYSNQEKKVLDWDGFAGCWFLPCMVYAWKLTGEERYLESAERAERFYSGYVHDLNCYSTPMDTWKAVDEEGNLAFVREFLRRLCYQHFQSAYSSHGRDHRH